ncbi:hypothetical protein [Desulfovibrio inopinatus]|uniref:hypothetical protein n=1 Tax=Desulfovibrio inopinatus TaxID=102109 RepID=UPI000423649D|nr:hypothetical protein [Desulfovibrio inopinatus]
MRRKWIIGVLFLAVCALSAPASASAECMTAYRNCMYMCAQQFPEASLRSKCNVNCQNGYALCQSQSNKPGPGPGPKPKPGANPKIKATVTP